MGRSAGGNYSLAVGNPVSPNTTISSTWANSTLQDIATGITDSLSRDGLGGMRQPLKIVDGISGAPGLTFGEETSTGLYRIDTGVVGLSLLGNTYLTAGDGDIATNYVLRGTKGLTITQSTSNTAGATITGNGTAAGGVFTGGSSAGRGLTITGGASGGTGAVITGGSGNGVGAVITGGSTGAGATIAAGGGNNVGATITGAGTGNGLSVTGAIGVLATGTSAEGMAAIGASGSAGLKARAGTAATATVAQTSLYLEDGYLGFRTAALGTAVTPNSDVGFSNTLGPNSFAKAHCVVEIVSGTPTIQGKGKNIASVSIVTNGGLSAGVLRVTFTTAMASAWYTAIPGVMSASIPGKHANIVAMTSSRCDIAVFTSGTGGTVVDLTSGSAVVSVIVMGEQ